MLANTNAIAFEWPDKNNTNSSCKELLNGANIPYCLSTNSSPKIALLGDSHANALYEYVATYFSEKDIGVIMLGQSGCPPFVGVERDAAGCPDVMENAIKYVEKNSNITNVYITGRFAATQSGINFGGQTPENFYSLKLISNPSKTDRSEIFRIGLGSILERLNKSHKTVTIILDLPELNFDPKSCLSTRGNSPCSIEKSTVLARQQPYRQIISEMQSEYGFRIVDLIDAFCDDTKCRAKFNGNIVYRDTHHLGVNASKFLINSGFQID